MFGVLPFAVAPFAGVAAVAGSVLLSGTSLSWQVTEARSVAGIKRKQPVDVRLFDFDFSLVPEMAAGDVVTEAVITQQSVSGAGALTISDPVIIGNKVKFSIGGGTLWATYRVQCAVTTAGGRTITGTGHVWVI